MADKLTEIVHYGDPISHNGHAVPIEADDAVAHGLAHLISGALVDLEEDIAV
jgi:hypothetical protein